MATDSFADAVPSFRYLRNNAMTPVHIRKKDITAPIISSRSSLRKSGSINCCLRMNHLQLHSDLPSAGQKTRSSNTLNSRFAILANIKQKLTKCEHREDASPVMPAQQRPPISHGNSCAGPAKVGSDTASIVGFALTQVVLWIDFCRSAVHTHS